MSGQLPRKSSLRDEKSRNSPTMHNVPRKMSMFDERGMLITHPPEDRPRRLSLLRPLRRNSEVDGHGVETGPGLDEEMEKVFAMGEEDRFDVARFATSPDSNTSKRSFNEKDYSFHRKKSYPHMHAPLKSLYSRSIRRKEVPSPRVSESESIEGGASIEANESRKLSQTGTDSDTGWSSPPMPLHPTINEDNSTRSIHSGTATPEEEEKEEHVFSSESEPQVSERAFAHSESPVFGSPSDTSRRVQFQIGDQKPVTEGAVEDEQPTADEEAERRDSVTEDPISIESDEKKKQKRKHMRHHHYRRKYSLQEDGGYKGRVRAGSDFSVQSSRRISIQPEEMSMLQEQDIDDLTSHRFDDAKGFRRYKIQSKGSISSVIHIGRKDRMEPLQTVLPLHTLKKMFDHSPHEVFVQLDELHGDGDEREWKETARWIKYEEDVEEGADRWGRPHVASLSFHSLLNLRRCLETGVVLLDLEEKDLPGVAYRVVEQMVVEELIEPEDKPTIMRALLLRHRHVNEHDRFRFGMKRTFSSYTSLQSLSLMDVDEDTSGYLEFIGEFRSLSNNLAEDKGRPKIVPSIASMDTVSSLKSPPPVNNHSGHNEFETKPENHTSIQVEMKEELTYTSSTEDLKKAAKESILKRIPLGAEATTVLVGAVDFLEQPTIAFVRLAEGIFMPSITEVPIPVRFLFILLGPTNADLDYHEIGRSISTLMSNTQFHKVAYKADERKELLSAINEFLDDSIVLPPGDWERKALLPFGELKAKSEMIRRRKNTRLMEADESKKALLLLEAEGEKPPYDDPLRRTRVPFGGLVNDVKRRFPHYKSDITEGLNLQCLAAAIFMYFAALSGAITFGGLMADKTDNLIGISETLLATSAAGILFALLAGQPLIIIGATGPLLLFDESLYNFCLTNGLDFLTVRVYIGLWLGIIGLVVVCFEGSVLVKLFTRFTEEIFAALISILYIFESIVKLYVVFHEHPLMAVYCSDPFIYDDTMSNSTDSPKNRPHVWNDSGIYSSNNLETLSLMINDSYKDNRFTENNGTTKALSSYEVQENHEVLQGQPNTALFCLILALGTFFIAYYLRQFRNSKFLGRSARRALGDFGVPIAIITMVTLDYLVPETYTEKLQVPEGLSPSSPTERGWIISPDMTHVWLMFAAAAPALLVYILLFMETHICELIIDKRERRLKKGSGFHLDIVVVCIANVGCGLLGAPWQCAATVRSIAHVSAVTVMSRTHAPGDKPHIIEVKEQRLSALFVSVFVGVSVLMAPLLRLVPMSVLFGVFLYMGISSTNGIQFFERLKLFFMPVKHHPQAAYVRRVHSMKMHLFTLIQLLCLAVLWVVKSTEASLAFPFFLILMVPLRAQLRFLFTPEELRALDSEEADSESLEDEPDFYTEAPLPG